jgi:uncharacterized protein (DUF952 family)
MIYNLLRADEWAELEDLGVFEGSVDDKADGFIHFSTAAQARETAAKHFAGEKGVVLAEVDPAKLPASLKWETSRGGQLFPHLYGALPLAAVTRHWPLPLSPQGKHRFPDGLTD